jgi:hypothetical protein
MGKALMQEAIDIEDFELMEKGLPPRAKKKPNMAVPDPPIVKSQVRYEEIPTDQVKGIEARRSSVRNDAGALFMGFDVSIALSGKKPIAGWMSEDDFLKLRRSVGDKIDLEKITF